MRDATAGRDTTGELAWDEDILEAIAVGYHSLYRHEAAEQRWRGPMQRMAWSALPEALRESNRATARALPDYLAAMGMTIRHAVGAPVVARLPSAGVERAAQVEHQRWVDERRARGYMLGPADDNAEPPTHPDLVPWEDLDEAARDKDHIRVARAPEILATLGLEIVQRRASAADLVSPGGSGRAHLPGS